MFTEIGEFPHMAAIGYDVEGNIEFNCGGTLISPNFVLSAGKMRILKANYILVKNIKNFSSLCEHEGCSGQDG